MEVTDQAHAPATLPSRKQPTSPIGRHLNSLDILYTREKVLAPAWLSQESFLRHKHFFIILKESIVVVTL
jgi:hypothetical protein